MSQEPERAPQLDRMRQLAIDALCEHFANDVIAVEEFERRIDRAHAATTSDALVELLRDLPSGNLPAKSDEARHPSAMSEAGLVRPKEKELVLAVLGGSSRKGRWVPARTNYSVALLGGVALDFREALLSPGVTELQVYALWGGVEIIVPPGLQVESQGVAILGGFDHAADGLQSTDPDAPKHRGISYILVPMKQEGIEVRPIKQMSGGAEFAEVFYDGAKAHKDHVVGGVNNGWKVGMGTLAFERGASTLGQQYLFQKEFEQVIAAAKETGAAEDPIIRQRLAAAWIGLKIMRVNALRMLEHQGADLNREALISKLYWSNWHRDLGKLAMDILGLEGELIEGGPYELTPTQKWYLFSRADTIYAGSNQIQRNIIGERGLGLPKEPR